MPNTVELRERRAKLVADARKILDSAEAEKRELTADERASWDKMMSDVDSLKVTIDAEERQARAESDLERDDSPERRAQSASGLTRHPWESRSAFRNRERRSTPAYRAAFVSYLVNGQSGIASGVHARALSADVDISGGAMVPPQQFLGQLIKAVDNLVILREKASKFTLNSAASLGAPALDTDISDADWTTELGTGSEDSSMATGKRELTPHPLAKRIKVSEKLLRLSANTGSFSQDGSASVSGAEALVIDRMSYKFAVVQETAFFTGNGAGQPLGMYTASARGVSTGRDVTCGTTTDFTADGLMDVKYNLKSQYIAEAEWFFHRDGYKRVRKLKDGNGQYLWGPGLNAGEPDMLLDRPVNLSEYNPNTFTTGLYVCMFCVPKFYWIADSLSMTIQRLNELYAETAQVGFIGRAEVDGMPVLEEAFSRGKLA